MRTVSSSIVELNQQKLCLAPDVRVWPVRERGETVYRIEIEGQHRFFRVGYRESYLCSLLDGNPTLAQACSLAAAELGRDAPTEKETSEIARWLLDNEIAYLAGDRPPVRDSDVGSASARADQQSAWKLLGRLNPFWIKVPIPGGGHAVKALAGALSPLLSRPMVFAGVLLMLSALVGALTHRDLFLRETENIFHPGRWVWMLGIWVALKNRPRTRTRDRLSSFRRRSQPVRGRLRFARATRLCRRIELLANAVETVAHRRLGGGDVCRVLYCRGGGVGLPDRGRSARAQRLAQRRPHRWDLDAPLQRQRVDEIRRLLHFGRRRRHPQPRIRSIANARAFRQTMDHRRVSPTRSTVRLAWHVGFGVRRRRDRLAFWRLRLPGHHRVDSV
ncbi:peptidase, M50 family [Rhodopirellula sallentina SM41]|uniref:Peptidase, M50 family n=1 Tax=Rhodopirellula sallentina SM41 TaxID=1263870 RepID=M5U2N4_9BACT|nr:peptidase, M50 family [Rhodopirellula sallentina SM41]